MHIIMSTIYGSRGHGNRRFETLAADSWTAFARRLREILDTLVTWQERAAERRHLSELDARMLRDIGISRADVRREADKPFWRP